MERGRHISRVALRIKTLLICCVTENCGISREITLDTTKNHRNIEDMSALSMNRIKNAEKHDFEHVNDAKMQEKGKITQCDRKSYNSTESGI